MKPLPPSGAYPASDFTAREEMARSVGLEPTTSASAGLRSIQTELRARDLVPKGGFEPPRPFRALRPERSASAVPPLRLLQLVGGARLFLPLRRVNEPPERCAIV